jgi:hypothetical protein
MALAAATVSQDGLRPAARLVISVHTPNQGWAVIPAAGSPAQVFSKEVTLNLQQQLTIAGEPTWQATGLAKTGKNQNITWFVGGTNASWKGTPIALALVVEAGDVDFTRQAGGEILQAAIHY